MVGFLVLPLLLYPTIFVSDMVRNGGFAVFASSLS